MKDVASHATVAKPTGQKIFLPWRPNESRFAPQQYYYAASKSGVVPSRVISVRILHDMTPKRDD